MNHSLCISDIHYIFVERGGANVEQEAAASRTPAWL